MEKLKHYRFAILGLRFVNFRDQLAGTKLPTSSLLQK